MDDTTRGVGDERTRGIGEEPAKNYAADEGRRTREIRAEIEQTREDMSETIDAIQEKLRPGNIVAEAKDRVKSATTERVRQMADTASETAQQAYEQTRQVAGDLVEGARSNAVPAAMIGVGVAWLLVDRFRQNNRNADYRRWRSTSPGRPEYYGSDDYQRSTSGPLYGSRHEDEGAGYRDAGYGTRSAASGLSETAADLRQRTMRTGRRARNQFQRLLYDNPLMVGAAAVVVGAAIGMTLPETERENEWLGETRDNVVDKAQDVARNAATRAQAAAGEVAEKVVRGE